MFQSAPFSGAKLGQIEQQWFARAKAAVAAFDDLYLRARSLASPKVRGEIIRTYVGDASSPDSGLYRRNSVAYNISQAESYTPINYLIFGAQQQNRVEKLEDLNRTLETEVKASESIQGVLPEPVTIERVVEIPGPTTVQKNLVVPIVIGTLALALVGYLVFGD